MPERLTEPKPGQPIWEPTDSDIALIDKLLKSNDELERAYGEAYRQRCFVALFGTDEHGIAAVGDLDYTAAIEQEFGIEIDVSKLNLAQCFMNLQAKPGQGETWPARVLDGLSRAVQARAYPEQEED